ncbi:(S)-coclaurine N-methyltransferase-like isoform X2 [Papaver somniferum]|uniref:(S)-coclaurine N-methyltransferase-like isoform X2 n=1 Tax=Papaver somniferum TaxID=3469 RepID=UPI000E701726|nr:(S)-coclaurine N-methyltransferase-like isoform X2 [Papaver somniferum]
MQLMAKEELLQNMELGLIPDQEIRERIRIELEKRLRWGYKETHEEQLSQLLDLVHCMKMATEMENLDLKLYEAPMEFLKIQHGSNMKQSAGYYTDESTTLDEAEIAMLDLYMERAQIKDGQSVLDLGCGLGAVALYGANKFKKCQFTGVTSSVEQKDYIQGKCKELKLTNVKVLLADITTYETEERFDRIFAVELIEHMKNYQLLLKKISEWMKDDGLLFVEHVCHKTLAYHYEPVDAEDWYTNYVFPAGTLTLSSASMLLYFQVSSFTKFRLKYIVLLALNHNSRMILETVMAWQDDVAVVNQWTLSGKHYSRSHEEWLKNMDKNIVEFKEIMRSITKTEEEANRLLNFWRIFCMCGAELFGYKNGEEWMLTHLLFKKK